MKTALVSFAISTTIFLLGCECGRNRPTPASQVSVAQKTEEAKPTRYEFSNESIDIGQNGNIKPAMLLMEDIGPDSLKTRCDTATAGQITKAPYSYIAHLIKIGGKINSIQELSPSVAAGWHEVMLLTKNENSAFGSISIDYLYNGDVSEMKTGDAVICYGCFIGTAKSENIMGGNVEVLAIVGNRMEKYRPRIIY